MRVCSITRKANYFEKLECPPSPSACLAFLCRCAAVEDMNVLIAVEPQRGMPLPWDVKPQRDLSLLKAEDGIPLEMAS